MSQSLTLSRGSLELIAAPASEPVTVTEAKAHARVETTADDVLLADYITAARELVERTTGRALITQTWCLTLDAWPMGRSADFGSGVAELPISYLDGVSASFVEIRKAPFMAVTSVQTLDESDTATTWAASNYYVTRHNGLGRLVRKQSVAWPTIVNRDFGAIRINFTAGYGASASDVPLALRQAIKDIVAHWYEHREVAGEASLNEAPLKTTAILQRFTVAR